MHSKHSPSQNRHHWGRPAVRRENYLALFWQCIFTRYIRVKASYVLLLAFTVFFLQYIFLCPFHWLLSFGDQSDTRICMVGVWSRVPSRARQITRTPQLIYICMPRHSRYVLSPPPRQTYSLDQHTTVATHSFTLIIR